MEVRENEDCDEQLMAKLAQLLQQINAYAKAYKSMYEMEQEEIKRAVNNGQEPKKFTMRLRHESNRDNRRYNLPSANEIAVVFEDDDGQPPHNRDFCVHLRSSRLTKQISFLNSNLDPMVYPLLFPECDEGWSDHLKRKNNNRVSQMEFYSYRIAIREEFNPILWGGKLFQQYVVDAYCKAEANRLNYIKTHQADLRAESYAGLMDYLSNMAENRGMKAGIKIILPSTYYGSPRNMREMYLDAMRVS